MEKDVKWEEIREKENCLTWCVSTRRNSMISTRFKQTNANLEKLMSDEIDKMYQVLRKISSSLMILELL